MSKIPHILIVEDDKNISYYLQGLMEAEHWKVTVAYCGKTAQALLTSNSFQAILLDYSLPDMTGTEFLAFSKTHYPSLPIFMHTGYDDGKIGFETSKAGADGFIVKGCDFEVIKKALSPIFVKPKKKNVIISVDDTLSRIIGNSAVVQQLKKDIIKFARSNPHVLILGPNGSGKELVAAALHANSRRVGKPYIIDNAAAGNSELIDDKYFGHSKGAFSGADSDRDGFLVEADGGTLFIDEIGNMSMLTQEKLLRAIEYQEVTPLGTTKTKKINTRIIAATNKDLDFEIKEGRFKEDLYYRLSTLVIEVPSLNERLDDIPLLAEHFINLICAEEESEIKVLNNDALELLQSMNWKGNIRQLSSVLRRAVIDAGRNADVLKPENFRILKKK